MKANILTYTKNDNSKRTICFVKLTDLPPKFLSTKVSKDSKSHVLKEGYELVWDLEASNFRVINTKTAEKEKSLELSENLFLSGKTQEIIQKLKVL